MDDLISIEKKILEVQKMIIEKVEELGSSKIVDENIVLKVNNDIDYEQALYLKGMWDLTTQLLGYIGKKLDKYDDYIDKIERKLYS